MAVDSRYLTLGHYRIAEKIGEGGMGEVYRARDERLERDVAVKVLRPGALPDERARKRFRKEALALSRLNHPNIETIFDYDTDNGVDFIAVEYIHGEGMDQKLAHGAMQEKDIILFGSQLADGLAAAHGQNVIHRDLKPSNLRITPDGRLKILDFGLAKLESATEASAESAQFAGTLPYMAPEQVRGEPLDARSDIWSAGTVLYEMATGQRPFRAPGIFVTEAILKNAPAVPSSVNAQVSPALDAAILKCLDKDPDDRYQSAKELAVDLRRIAHKTGAGVGAVRSRVRCNAPALLTASAAFSRSATRVSSPMRWAAAGLAAMVLLGGGWWTVHRATANPASIHALAVLPLENLMGPEQEYFVEGMHDALIGELSQIAALRTVISRTSVVQYKGTSKSIPQIAKELGVDAVVEGSVFQAADSVRIHVQVIAALPHEHNVWAGTFDGELRNALALQKSVARAIAGQIRVTLTPKEQARLAGARSVNPEAYKHYLKGHQELDRGGEAAMVQALDDFRQAIAIDSTYAPAYAGLARAYARLGGWGSTVPPEAVRDPARAAALDAIARDSTLAEAYVVLGQIKWLFDWDWSGAEAAFRRGMELNPRPPVWTLFTYADYLTSVGRFDEALAVDRRAVLRDPLSMPGYNGLALALNCAGRYEEALVQLQKVDELTPNRGIVHAMFAENYILLGKLDEASRHTERAEILFREAGDRSYWAYLVWGYARENRRGDAMRVLSEMNPTPLGWMAVAYAGLGEREKALEYLEHAYERHEVALVYVKVRPVLAMVRHDPRFRRLLERMKFPD